MESFRLRLLETMSWHLLGESEPSREHWRIIKIDFVSIWRDFAFAMNADDSNNFDYFCYSVFISWWHRQKLVLFGNAQASLSSKSKWILLFHSNRLRQKINIIELGKTTHKSRSFIVDVSKAESTWIHKSSVFDLAATENRLFALKMQKSRFLRQILMMRSGETD